MDKEVSPKLFNFFGLIGLMFLIVAIPLTVKLAQTSQEIRNLAMEAYPSPSNNPCSENEYRTNDQGKTSVCRGGTWHTCPEGQTPGIGGGCIPIPTPLPIIPSPQPTPVLTPIPSTQPFFNIDPTQRATVVQYPLVYLPGLNKYVNISNNLVYDAETDKLMGPLENYTDYFYIKPTYADTYDPVSAKTYNSSAWQTVRNAADNALLDASPDDKIEAITSAFFHNIPYDQKSSQLMDTTHQLHLDFLNSPSDKTAEALTQIEKTTRIYLDQFYSENIPLEDKLAQDKMICVDIAIAEHAYLASRGIDSQLAGNSVLHHEYLYVTMNDQQYVVDPTWNLIMPLSEHAKKYNYSIDIDTKSTTYFAPLGNLQNNQQN